MYFAEDSRVHTLRWSDQSRGSSWTTACSMSSSPTAGTSICFSRSSSFSRLSASGRSGVILISYKCENSSAVDLRFNVSQDGREWDMQTSFSYKFIVIVQPCDQRLRVVAARMDVGVWARSSDLTSGAKSRYRYFWIAGRLQSIKMDCAGLLLRVTKGDGSILMQCTITPDLICSYKGVIYLNVKDWLPLLGSRWALGGAGKLPYSKTPPIYQLKVSRLLISKT